MSVLLGCARHIGLAAASNARRSTNKKLETGADKMPCCLLFSKRRTLARACTSGCENGMHLFHQLPQVRHISK